MQLTHNFHDKKGDPEFFRGLKGPFSEEYLYLLHLSKVLFNDLEYLGAKF